MKKVFSWLSLCCVILALSSCSSSKPINIDNASSTVEVEQNSTQPAISDTVSNQQTPASDLREVELSEIAIDNEYLFTVEQQLSLTQQINDSIDKYKNGEYPLPMKKDTDYAPFAMAWPENLSYPEMITAHELIFTSEEFEMYGVGIRINLTNDYHIAVSIYANKDLNPRDNGYWGVDDFCFIKS